MRLYRALPGEPIGPGIAGIAGAQQLAAVTFEMQSPGTLSPGGAQRPPSTRPWVAVCRGDGDPPRLPALVRYDGRASIAHGVSELELYAPRRVEMKTCTGRTKRYGIKNTDVEKQNVSEAPQNVLKAQSKTQGIQNSNPEKLLTYTYT